MNRGAFKQIFVYILLPTTLCWLTTRMVLATTCHIGSVPGWFPPEYGYKDSVLSLYGKTQICWDGELFSHQGYSYGSQYPGQPLPGGIRAYVRSWEEIDGSRCTSIYTKDSGRKYGVYSVWARTAYRHWECTGAISHYYVAKTTHYFNNLEAITGNK